MADEIQLDWLILDVLDMKRISFNIGNKQLYEYCDYLERKLVGMKKGEVILQLGD